MAQAIGGYSSYPNFVKYVIDAWIAQEDAPNNRTRVDYNAYVYVTGSSASSSGGSGVIDGVNSNSIGSWSAGRYGTVGITSGSVWFGHNSDGTRGDIGFSGSSSMNGLGSVAVSSTLGGFPNYNRTAYAPSYNNITRTSSTNIYVTYARTGSVNGPTTYVLERATNSAMSQNYTIVSEGNQTVDANTAYYYRMYAYGDEGGAQYSGVYGPYWGQATPPTSVTGTRSTTTAGAINVTWAKPGNVQSGIDYYQVYRNGTYLAQVNGADTLSYLDTGLTRGSNYTYQVYAHTAEYLSGVSNTSTATMAPGVPSAPGTPTVSSKVGRTLTLNSTRGSADYGNSISEYRIQLSTDDGSTWKGWDNTSKSFTANNTYNVLDGSGNFTYSLLTPALTYKWRVYAINSIGTGDAATMSSGTFVGAGGKRFDGTSWQPTATSKRFDGTNWVDFTTAKRFDGTNWVDLT
jgi:hypothetical protein